MNQLQYETSPYLLQHAQNPVDWYAWKPEAFEKAKKENKPILVSIGYSTCHWCHVMERESFENEEVAAIMNEHFVNIKVDREERPDVDQIYMEACQIINGSGGWPLNCFLLPDGRPFYAGTYYPPEAAHGRPSWTQVLTNLSNAFKNKREVVEDQAQQLTEVIQKSDGKLFGNTIQGLDKEEVFTTDTLTKMYFNLHERFDTVYGGFGGAPKFPGSMTLNYLLNYYYFTQYEEAISQVHLSFTKMIQGGMYDQIGGGFARYAVDSQWLVPHFEKMLYDNALLISVLAETYKFSKKELYKTTIEETLEWVSREMTNDEGGFFSALDADSEGVEGKFYVWSKQEILDTLGEFGPLFTEFYQVTEKGNWEETNILNRPLSFEEFAHQKNIDDIADFKIKIKKANKQLLALRAQRIRPGLDDKSLLDWNALMISAYAKAYSALKNESYKTTAEKALDFVLTKFKQPDGFRLYHTWKDGQAQYDAFLNDYAFLIEALLDVYEINFETSLLETAEKYIQFVLDEFFDKDTNLFFFTSENQEALIARQKNLYDSALPSGNATMVRNLQRLGILLDRTDYRTTAANMLLKITEALEKYPLSFGRWATAFMNEVYGFKEIAVVGKEALQKAEAINEWYVPNKIIMASIIEKENYPLLVGKIADFDTYIYICENFACQQPVKSIEKAKQLLTPIWS